MCKVPPLHGAEDALKGICSSFSTGAVVSTRTRMMACLIKSSDEAKDSEREVGTRREEKVAMMIRRAIGRDGCKAFVPSNGTLNRVRACSDRACGDHWTWIAVRPVRQCRRNGASWFGY